MTSFDADSILIGSRSRRRCVKGRVSYVEPDPLGPALSEDLDADEDRSNSSEIPADPAYDAPVEAEEIDEEPVTIDLSDFLNETALLAAAEAVMENTPESTAAALTDSHSQFRVTSLKPDPVTDLTSLKHLTLDESTESSLVSGCPVSENPPSTAGSDLLATLSNIPTDPIEENISVEKNIVIQPSASEIPVSEPPLSLSNACPEAVAVSEDVLANTAMEALGKFPIVRCEKLNMENFVKKNTIKVGNWPLPKVDSTPKGKVNASKSSSLRKLKPSGPKTPKIFRPITFNRLAPNTVRSILVNPFEIKTSGMTYSIGNSNVHRIVKPHTVRNSWNEQSLGNDSIIKLVSNNSISKHSSYSSPAKNFPLITSVNKVNTPPKTLKIISPKKFSPAEHKNSAVTPILPRPVIEAITSPVLLNDAPYTVIEPYVDDPTSPVKPKPILTVPLEVIPAIEESSEPTSSEYTPVSKVPSKFSKSNRSVFLNGAIKQTSVPARHSKKQSPRSKSILTENNLVKLETILPNSSDVDFEEEASVNRAKTAVVDAMASVFSKNLKKQIKSKPNNRDSITQPSYGTDGSMFGCQSYNNSLNDILFGFSSVEELIDENMTNCEEVPELDSSNKNIIKLTNHSDVKVPIKDEKHRTPPIKKSQFPMAISNAYNDSDTLSASECGDDSDVSLPETPLKKRQQRKCMNKLKRSNKYIKESDESKVLTPSRTFELNAKKSTKENAIPQVSDKKCELKAKKTLSPNVKIETNSIDKAPELGKSAEDKSVKLSIKSTSKETRISSRGKRKQNTDDETTNIKQESEEEIPKISSKKHSQISKNRLHFIQSRLKPNIKLKQSVKVWKKGRKSSSKPSDIIKEIKTITSGNTVALKGKGKATKENAFSNTSEIGMSKPVSRAVKHYKKKIKSARTKSKKKIKTLKVLFKKSKNKESAPLTPPSEYASDENSLSHLNESNSVPDNDDSVNSFDEKISKSCSLSKEDISAMPCDTKLEKPDSSVSCEEKKNSTEISEETSLESLQVPTKLDLKGSDQINFEMPSSESEKIKTRDKSSEVEETQLTESPVKNDGLKSLDPGIISSSVREEICPDSSEEFKELDSGELDIKSKNMGESDPNMPKEIDPNNGLASLEAVSDSNLSKEICANNLEELEDLGSAELDQSNSISDNVENVSNKNIEESDLTVSEERTGPNDSLISLDTSSDSALSKKICYDNLEKPEDLGYAQLDESNSISDNVENVPNKNINESDLTVSEERTGLNGSLIYSDTSSDSALSKNICPDNLAKPNVLESDPITPILDSSEIKASENLHESDLTVTDERTNPDAGLPSLDTGSDSTLSKKICSDNLETPNELESDLTTPILDGSEIIASENLHESDLTVTDERTNPDAGLPSLNAGSDTTLSTEMDPNIIEKPKDPVLNELDHGNSVCEILKSEVNKDINELSKDLIMPDKNVNENEGLMSLDIDMSSDRPEKLASDEVDQSYCIPKNLDSEINKDSDKSAKNDLVVPEKTTDMSDLQVSSLDASTNVIENIDSNISTHKESKSAGAILDVSNAENLTEQKDETSDIESKADKRRKSKRKCPKLKISKAKTKINPDPYDKRNWYISERKASTDSTEYNESPSNSDGKHIKSPKASQDEMSSLESENASNKHEIESKSGESLAQDKSIKSPETLTVSDSKVKTVVTSKESTLQDTSCISNDIPAVSDCSSVIIPDPKSPGNVIGPSDRSDMTEIPSESSEKQTKAFEGITTEEEDTSLTKSIKEEPLDDYEDSTNQQPSPCVLPVHRDFKKEVLFTDVASIDSIPLPTASRRGRPRKGSAKATSTKKSLPIPESGTTEISQIKGKKEFAKITKYFKPQASEPSETTSALMESSPVAGRKETSVKDASIGPTTVESRFEEKSPTNDISANATSVEATARVGAASLGATSAKEISAPDKASAPPAVTTPKTVETPNNAQNNKGRKRKFCPEAVKVPFDMGWMREMVHRATEGKIGQKMSDIYYFSPEGIKLRSMIEIGNYLSKHSECKLTLENFTFAKECVFREPFERERSAKQRSVLASPPVFYKTKILDLSAEMDAARSKGTPRKISPPLPSMTKLTIKNVNQGLQAEKKFTCILGDSSNKTNKSNQSAVKRKNSSFPMDNSAHPAKKLKVATDAPSAKNRKVSTDAPSAKNRKVSSDAPSAKNRKGSSDAPPAKKPRVLSDKQLSFVSDSLRENSSSTSKNNMRTVNQSKGSTSAQTGSTFHQKLGGSKTPKSSNIQSRAEEISLLPKEVFHLPCTSRCPVAQYQIPNIECPLCLCLFHPHCVPNVTKGVQFACKSCISEKLACYKNARYPCPGTSLLSDEDPGEEREDISQDLPLDIEVSVLFPEIELTVSRTQLKVYSSLKNQNQLGATSTGLYGPVIPSNSTPSRTVPYMPCLVNHLLSPTSPSGFRQIAPKPNVPLQMFPQVQPTGGSPGHVMNANASNRPILIRCSPSGKTVIQRGLIVTVPPNSSPLNALANLSRDAGSSTNWSTVASGVTSPSALRIPPRTSACDSIEMTSKFQRISDPLRLNESILAATLTGRTYSSSGSSPLNQPVWDVNRFLTSYECLNLVFKMLDTCDLLRAGKVCKSWNSLSTQNFLWEKMKFDNIMVTNWRNCCLFLKKVGTKHLDFSDIIHQFQETPFKDLENYVSLLNDVQEVVFDQVPSSLVQSVALNLHQLRKLECHFVTNALTEPEIWTSTCEFKLSSLQGLNRLIKLKIKTGGKIVVHHDPEYLMPFLPNLRHLTLTGFTFGSHINLECLSMHKELISLELGDCMDIEPEVYLLLKALNNLRCLRLENGGSLEGEELVECLKGMKKLEILELMNFKIPNNLAHAFESFPQLIHLNIWPDTTSEGSLVNYNLFQALSICKDLSYACWGVITDGEDAPDVLEMSSSDKIEELSYEELFHKLVDLLPECRVEVKFVPRKSWREFCSTRE